MRIIQVLNHFLPHQTAGTEVYTWALSKQLQQKTIDVEIIIPNYGQKLSAHYVYDGLKVFQYAEPSVVDRSLIMGFRKPDGLAAFQEHLKNEKPDIVHFHELAGSNGITSHHVIAAKKTGAKVLMTFHLAGYSCKTGNLVYKEEQLCDGLIDISKCSECYLHSKASPAIKPLLHSVSNLLYKLGTDTTKWQHQTGTALGTAFIIDHLKKNFETLIQHCDKVVVLTRWYKKILMLNGVPEEKISYVPQGLPFDAVVRSTVENEHATTPVRLIFLGRISPLKGLHLLLEALQRISEDEIELDIYGQSNDEGYEAAWRNKTSGRKNIRWKGKLQQQDVVSTMKQYDALCLCSTFSEMSPLVIQEAFAAGITVIASNVYGNAEQIEHDKNGLLFRFKDGVSLQEQLLRCINEPDLLRKLRKNIQPPRCFEQVGEDYYKLYQSLLSDI